MDQSSTDLAPTSIIARSEEQLSCEVDGEIVLMHVDTGRYFGYDAVGSRIWTLLETPTSVSALCARLAQEYEGADPETCRADVLPFLSELASEGLITVRPGSTS